MPTVTDMFDMTGKAAIVTGGATHLGRAMATALCELGASVTIASRRAALCEQVAAQLRDEGYDCVGAGCDVTSEEDVNDLVDVVTARTGRLDVMVCNAGGSGDLPSTYVPNSSVEEFMSTIDINLKGAYLCAQAAARVMVKQRSGSIITIGSIHGFTTSDKRFYDGLDMRRGGVAYQTSKGGVIQLTRNLAGELGEYGVTANCISPGQIPTPGANAEIVERFRLNQPIPRTGAPDDLKGAVALLASPAGAWITGHNLVVDGGWTIW